MQVVKRRLYVRIKPHFIFCVVDCRKNKGVDSLAFCFAQNLHAVSGQAVLAYHAAPYRIVNIVIDIGNPVGKLYDSSLKRLCRRTFRVAQNTVSDFKGQIQPSAVVFD